MRKQLLVPLMVVLLPCFSWGQAINSNLLGQITISGGGVSNKSMNANLASIYNLYPRNSINTSTHGTGIKSNPNSTININLYPNPSSEVINIKNDDPNLNSFSVRVFNINGDLVLVSLNTNEKTTRLSTSKLSSGTYIANIYNSDNQLIKNFKFSKI